MVRVQNYGGQSVDANNASGCSCYCLCTCYLFMTPNANYQANGCAYGSTNGENLAKEYSLYG
jgi:hypothetical protein